MNKRGFLQSSGAAIVGLGLNFKEDPSPAASNILAVQNRKPNILFILADNLG